MDNLNKPITGDEIEAIIQKLTGAVALHGETLSSNPSSTKTNSNNQETSQNDSAVG
jgi:hypothetical protein